MNYDFYWEQFEKTGNISDYLNYTACTNEEAYLNHKDEIVCTEAVEKENCE